MSEAILVMNVLQAYYLYIKNFELCEQFQAAGKTVVAVFADR